MRDTSPNKFAGLIVVLIEAFLVLGVSMGWFILSDVQMQSWMAFIVALAAVITPAIGFYWSSTKQTPLADPKDKDGVAFVREDGARPMMMAEK